VFTVDVSCLARRPLPEVFDFVADFRNAPGWQPQLHAVRLDDGPFPAGTRVVEIHHFLGRRVEAVGDLVQWEQGRGFTVQGRSALLKVTSRYRFAAQPDGTRVSLALTMDPRGPARLAEPVLRRQLRDSLTASFVLLRQALEGTRAVPPAG